MRVKRGLVKHRRHKEVLKNAKGYRMSYSKLYKRAKEALLHAGHYSQVHRKRRGSQFRAIWTATINSAVRPLGLSYSKFIFKLKQSDVQLNRKILAYLAYNHQDAFNQLVKEVK